MNNLFPQIFQHISWMLDISGGSAKQNISLSPEAFDELKTFITQWDEWNKSLPRFAGDPDPIPMLPNLQIEQPFLLYCGYKFQILIAK